MAYDTELAQQIRAALSGQKALSEKEMFGGIGFMIAGNMACGVTGDDLLVRVGPEAYEAALGIENVGVFDMTGRPMRGWVVVAGRAIKTEADLRSWVEKGITFARTLPEK